LYFVLASSLVSYDYHNLIFDVPWKGMRRQLMMLENTRSTEAIQDQEDYVENSERNGKGVTPIELVKPIFSIIKHYPPKWKQDLQK
jgi:hypothetical protein